MRRLFCWLASAIYLSLILIGSLPSPVHADGTEILGPPGVEISSGTDLVAAGTGLALGQPGMIDITLPPGAEVQQVLLYWDGIMTEGIAGDDTALVNGTPVTASLIGGPTLFTDGSAISAFRADITDLGLVSPGPNTLEISGLDFSEVVNGAGVLVIINEGGTQATIDLRDGSDWAFINASGDLMETVSQTFNFAMADFDRTASLAMFFSSVAGSVSGNGLRPSSIEITVNGSVTTLSDVLDSNDGEEWDTLNIPVLIPAGASQLTVQAFSRNDNPTPETPASFDWVTAALSVPPSPVPCIDIEKQISVDGGQTWFNADTEQTAPGTDNGALYRLMLKNCGDLDLENVVVQDNTPNFNIDVPIGLIPVGGELTFTSADQGFETLEQPNRCEDPLPPTKPNTAMATGEANGVTISDQDEAWVKCVCIDLEKQISVDMGQTWLDADIVEDAPFSTAGAMYRLIVSNCGGFDLTDVTVNDEALQIVDANIGLLAFGEQITILSDDPPEFVPFFDNLQQPERCTGAPPEGESKLNTSKVSGSFMAGTPDEFITMDTDDAWVNCLPCSGIIGDRIWEDLNNNGIQDLDEPGIGAVVVTLKDTQGQVIATATTLSDGAYEFSGLCAGEYTVEVETPPGFVPSPCNIGDDDTIDNDCSPAGANLPDDMTEDDTIDFGFFRAPAMIGDRVWNDLDRDGIQDPDEPGVPGVLVELRDCADVVFATTETDSEGNFKFTVDPDDYNLRFILPDGFEFTLRDQGDDDSLDSDAGPDGTTDCTSLTPGEDDPTWDAGMFKPCTGTIGDFVWFDLNRNGIQDNGEPGIAEVPVTLLDATGALADTTTTNGSGFYEFTGLCAGDYTVAFTTPDGLEPTEPNAPGSNDDNDSDGTSVPVTLPADDATDDSVDSGFVVPCTGTIGDFVWFDLNRNGIQDNGEPGIAEVPVTLLDATGALVDTTTTNGSGSYEFTGLCAGDYTVAFTTPDGLEPTEPNAPGSNDDNDSDGTSVPVTLPADDATDDSVDSGFVVPCTGTIGDFVWNDLNRNGIQDNGEPGIAGLTVTLSGNGVSATDTTDANGVYGFTGLCAGDYIVEVEPPANFVPSACNQGPDDTTDNDCSPAQTTLPTDDAQDPNVDFGFNQPCSGVIGDRVWEDLDNDGIQDAGEPGIGGIIVTLKDSADQTIATTTTNGNGTYSFTGLCAGDYVVEVATPPGTIAAPCNQGGDDTVDNDCSPASVNLPGDFTEDETIDFGYFRAPAMIGDRVWNDFDQDGIQDQNEPGIGGVTVHIMECGGPIRETTVTDQNGFYSFTVEDPADYNIAFELPAGFVFSPRDQGSDDTTDSDADPNSGETDCTTLDPDENDPTWDAGMFQPEAMIGDFVWNDLDQDGIQDANEPGISNATVNLLDCNGNIVETTATDPNGNFKFTVAPGDYNLQFILPAGFTDFSPQDQGANDALDSDALPLFGPDWGTTVCTTLAAGEDDTTWDAGMFTVEPGLTIEKSTNGEDADNPPGPALPVGAEVTWTYEVTNTGNAPLDNLSVTDDRLQAVSCPQDSLEAGESMTCTASGIVAEGQYANEGCAEGTTSSQTGVISLRVCDPSHYFGARPAIDIEKATNGEDADQPRGPTLAVGSPVTWTYMVTNIGNLTLTNVSVNDDQIGAITCPQNSLDPGQSMTCTANGIVAEGQYTNVGCVEGTTPGDMQIEDCDPSNHFGARPAIDIEKATNGEDADQPRGPTLPVGSPVTWTYMVTNTGNVALTNVSVNDDQIGAITCPQNSLDPGQSMTCTANGIVAEGQYTNLGCVEGTTPGDMQIEDCDPSNYFGARPAIDIEKATNGQDADDEPGPTLPVGDPVEWTYVVSNTGNVSLSAIVVNDDQLGAVSCPQTTLAPGETMTCTANGQVMVGQYSNLATVTGVTPGGMTVTDNDPSHYLGIKPSIDVEKFVSTDGKNWFDADHAPGIRVPICPTDGFGKCDPDSDDHSSDDDSSKDDSSKDDSSKDDSSKDDSSKDDSSSDDSSRDDKSSDDDSSDDGKCVDGFECRSNVFFKFEVTNDGQTLLNNIRLTDSSLDLSSCTVPTTLAIGESFECVIGPFQPMPGQHMNTATAKGDFGGMTAMDTDEAHYEGCTGKGVGSPGFWKNHPEAWPVDEITIGGKTFTKAKAIMLMNQSTRQDKTHTLFRALVAAKLNALACNVSFCIDEVIQKADRWFVESPVGSGVPGSSYAWDIGEPLYLKLDAYNNGKLCAPSRDVKDSSREDGRSEDDSSSDDDDERKDGKH